MCRGFTVFWDMQGFIEDSFRIFLRLLDPSHIFKDAPFTFTEECLQSFYTLKKALVSTPVIQPPNWHLPFEIMCDTSDYAIGAVLSQSKDKKHYAISYASKTLTRPQLNYTTMEKELLAVVFIIKKFRSYLLGIKVIVYIDDVALKYLLTKKDAK
jgi:hypothetical protein